MNQLLSESEINTEINQLLGWTRNQQKIQSIRTFKNFIEAINFVNKLVEPAESAGHHPDVEISYNRVTISLTTHDAGGLTAKDFQLAKTISEIV